MCRSRVAKVEAANCYPSLERWALEFIEFKVSIYVSIVGRNNRKAVGVNRGEGEVQMAETSCNNLIRRYAVAEAVTSV